MKTLIAIGAGILTAVLFMLMLTLFSVSYPTWLLFLVGYISMEADLIKMDIPGGIIEKIKKSLDD